MKHAFPAFLLILAGAVSARASIEDCQKDAVKFGCDKTASPQAWQDCMTANVEKLSFGCRSDVKRYKAPPCEGDMKKFCGDTPEGKMQKLACLSRHSKSLGEACRAELKRLAPCKKALQTLCPERDIIGQDLTSCLVEHNDEIGNECGKSMGIHATWREICMEKCQTIRVDACVTNNMEKMSKKCLKLWIKRPFDPAVTPARRKELDEKAAKILRSMP